MTIEYKTGNHVHHDPNRVFPGVHEETQLRNVKPGEVVIVQFARRPKPDNRLIVRVKGSNKKGGVLVEPLEETAHLRMVDTPGKRVGLSGNTWTFAAIDYNRPRG